MDECKAYDDGYEMGKKMEFKDALYLLEQAYKSWIATVRREAGIK